MKLNRLIKRLAHAAGNQWRRAITRPKPKTEWAKERRDQRVRQRRSRVQLTRLKALAEHAELWLAKWRAGWGYKGGDVVRRGGHLWILPSCDMVCLTLKCGDKDSLVDTVPDFIALVIQPIAGQFKPKGMKDSATSSKLREYKYTERGVSEDPLKFEIRIDWAHSARCQLVPTGEFEERMVSGPAERQMVEIKKIVCDGEAL